MICGKLSPSKLDLYERCPLAYHARYELKVRSPSTSATDMGLLVHAALEFYYNPNDSQTVDSAWEKAKEENNCSSLEDFEIAKKIYLGECAKFPKEAMKVIAVEKRFDQTLPNGVEVRGIIDRTDIFDDKILSINDYKTGNWVPNDDELELAHQSNMYPLALFRSGEYPDIEGIMFNYHYVRTGQIKSVYRTLESLEVYEEYLGYLADQITRDDKPEPKLNIFCYSCDYRDKCPAYAMVMNANFDDEETQKLLGPVEESVGPMALRSKSLSAASKALNTEKKRIDSWIMQALKDNDVESWDLGDMKVRLVSRKVTNYDMKTVMKLLGIESKVEAKKLLSVKSDVLNHFAHDADALEKLKNTAIVSRSKPYVSIR